MQSKFLLQLLVVASLTTATPVASSAQTADSTANNLLKQGDEEWAKGDLPSAFKSWTNAARALGSQADSVFTKRDLVVLREADGNVVLTIRNPATPAPSDGPRFPVALRNAGIEGSVTVAFVVKTDGRADVSSLRILKSTDDLFTQSVRDALPKLRFNAAVFQGQKVDYLIVRPFTFTIGKG